MSRARAVVFCAAAVVATLVAPVAAQADHCNGDVTQVDTPAGTFYVDNRDPTTLDVWVYQESNGQEGLQSGGAGALSEDLCAHENPDTLIF